MGLIADITALVGSGAFGGIFGFGASIIKRHLAIKEAAAQFERDLKLREFDRQDAESARAHEIKLHELNQGAADRENERAIRLADLQGRDAARLEVHKEQTALSSNPRGSQWTIDTLRMVRPILTALYSLLLAVVFLTVDDAELRKHIVYQIVFIAGMTVTWWFGERPPQDWAGFNSKRLSSAK